MGIKEQYRKLNIDIEKLREDHPDAKWCIKCEDYLKCKKNPGEDSFGGLCYKLKETNSKH